MSDEHFVGMKVHPPLNRWRYPDLARANNFLVPNNIADGFIMYVNAINNLPHLQYI